MSDNWIVIGISGVTCGGKTTLATELNKIIPKSHVISQDDYFLDVDDPRHTWVPELNHIHFDIMSSLDMEKMLKDVQTMILDRKNRQNRLCKDSLMLEEYTKNDLQKLVNKKLTETNTNVLILEGFCIFNYRPIEYLCDFKYFFQLDREECYARRIQRVYEPPDCSGYFEKCVWPEYLKQLKDVEENVDNVKYFDDSTIEPLAEVLLDIVKLLHC